MVCNCNKKNDWNQVEQSWVESSKKGTSGKEAFDFRQFKANWASECVFGKHQRAGGQDSIALQRVWCCYVSPVTYGDRTKRETTEFNQSMLGYELTFIFSKWSLYFYISIKVLITHSEQNFLYMSLYITLFHINDFYICELHIGISS